MEIIGWLFIGLFALVCLLALWRFVKLRAQGTQVLIRRMPANSARGWRHGVIRYRGELIDFFMLRSINPTPDVTFARHGFVLKGRREATSVEQKFMESQLRILEVETNRGVFEWAVGPHTEMALLAWVESAPTQPLQRMDVKTAQKYFKDK